MNKLKYLGYSIVFQEVPEEVTLAINVSGCPHRCEGCHSKYLWEYKGEYLTDDFTSIVNKYTDLITCVCFMGGEQNDLELIQMCSIAHKLGLKTALYTGCDFIQEVSFDLVANLDYIKVGHYDERCGGLDNINTNQRMFKWEGKWKDITYMFQRRMN